ncbi:hypothetical protein FNF27_05087 [Cafeteria roenbergensis]|uniref:Uncharacterized protein n=1 Tax=Cafeteria roenbergensis TaxID=33653 RepID=A0A5A8E9S0_CAFRO|nr:hypothetical protein FNF27_05087 [Cafeteria roenbergensis]
MSRSVSRRLRALHAPMRAVDTSDMAQVAACVVWLEDRVVRQWTEDKRSPLRSAAPGSSAWAGTVDSYLEEAGCAAATRRGGAALWLPWLLSHAVAVAYEGEREDIAAAAKAAPARLASPAPSPGSAPPQPPSSSSSSSSSSSAAASAGSAAEPAPAAPAPALPPALSRAESLDEAALAGPVADLLSALGLPAPAGADPPLAALRLCARQLRHVVLPALPKPDARPEAAAAAAAAASRGPAAGSSAAGGAARDAAEVLASVSPGVATGSPALDAGVLVLRLLYLGCMRDAQSRANAIIEAVQAFTADPRTDSSLGRVGR